jgi:hypothetical protein
VHNRQLVIAKMKLLTSLLVPAFIGAASAAVSADVYILQGKESSSPSNPTTLNPEQARLVLAQRLGSSRYHDLSSADETTLSYINQFGGAHESLFEDVPTDKAAELVLIVEGVDKNVAGLLLDSWGSPRPSFSILSPPSMRENQKLVEDLNKQCGQAKDCKLEDAINPFDIKCWNGKSKVIHYDLGDKKACCTRMGFDQLANRSFRMEISLIDYLMHKIEWLAGRTKKK